MNNTKKILFTHSYFLHFDPKQEKLGQPFPPLGTLYAASVMREKGYEVKVHDVMFQRNVKDIESILEKEKPDYFVIYDDGFNYLTKMCLTNMREAAFEMASIASSKNIPVIISSSDSTDHYDKYLSKGVSYVLLGEAEETLTELLERLEKNIVIDETLTGLAYKEEQGNTEINSVQSMRVPLKTKNFKADKKLKPEFTLVNEDFNFVVQRRNLKLLEAPIKKNNRRQVMKDLDNLPMPAWDLLNIEPYKKVWKEHNGYFMINMGTTRGCPYKCNWCAKPIYGNRYNSRSPKNVVEEIKWLQKNFQIENIWFSDDIFGLKPNWVHEFADLLEKEKLKIRYKIQSRADLLMQENYVADLARSGCFSVWIGAESGSQKILDDMDKGITVEDIKKSTLLLKRYKIKPSFFIQFGYLGEEMKDIEQTIALINEMLPEDIGVSVSYPLPGTKFYDRVKDDLIVKANWTDSDDLDLMFQNTYSPEFYKTLHRYVHKNYRKHQAIDSLKNIFGKTEHGTPPSLRKGIVLPYYAFSSWKYKRKLKNSK